MSVLEKKGCEQKRNDCSLNHAFFFVTFSQNSHWSHNFLCQKRRKKTLKAMKMMTSQTAISPLLILPH